MAQIPLYSQYDSMDCGPTCLRMIASFYGKDFSLEYLRDMCSITNRGVTLLGLDYAAKQIGFETLCAKVSLLQLCKDTPLPCIIHWNTLLFCIKFHNVGIKKSIMLQIQLEQSLSIQKRNFQDAGNKVASAVSCYV